MEVKNFPCTAAGVAEAQSFLEMLCDEPRPAIILDEIVSNIVRYSGAGSFRIGVERGGDGLLMEFTDDGIEFDPTRDAAVPDVSAPLEDRVVGGLGTFMVKKMSKSVVYRRENGKNILTVKM